MFMATAVKFHCRPLIAWVWRGPLGLGCVPLYDRCASRHNIPQECVAETKKMRHWTLKKLQNNLARRSSLEILGDGQAIEIIQDSMNTILDPNVSSKFPTWPFEQTLPNPPLLLRKTPNQPPNPLYLNK